MPKPEIIRATDATGEVYDDPSEDALYELMEDLSAPDSSLLVERLEPGREGEWVPVTRKASGLYELSSSENIEYVSALRSVHEFLTRWAFEFSPP